MNEDRRRAPNRAARLLALIAFGLAGAIEAINHFHDPTDRGSGSVFSAACLAAGIAVAVAMHFLVPWDKSISFRRTR